MSTGVACPPLGPGGGKDSHAGAAQGDVVPWPAAGASLRSGAGGGRCFAALRGSSAWGCPPRAVVSDV